MRKKTKQQKYNETESFAIGLIALEWRKKTSNIGKENCIIN